MKDLQTEYLTCECMSPEHTLRYVFILDNENPERSEINTEIHLTPYLPWYKRLVLAIRYVVGIRDRHSHWDNFIMKREDVARLRGLLEEFEKATK